MRRLIISLIVSIATNACLAAETVYFTDPNFEDVVCKQLRTSLPITKTKMLHMKSLYVNSKNISSLAGIENATNLIALRIYNCQIRDISSISKLTNLKELGIRNSNISDISAFSSLTNLSYLLLTDNKISDVSGLSNCMKLLWLDLSNNQIRDISALMNLRKLSRLNLQNNPLNEDSWSKHIPMIRSNNPDVVIQSGPQPSVVGISKFELLSAKGNVAEFSTYARFEIIPGVLRPQLPSVPEETLRAIKVLEEADDVEYLADIALIMVRYAAEIDWNYPPGALMHEEHPLLKTFVSALKPVVLPGDVISSGCLAIWICEHRDKMGPSILLDIEIDNYQKLQIELRQKYDLGIERNL